MIRESTFSPDPQTNEVEHLIQQIMHQMTAFQLAGFELLVKTVKSILLGLYAFSVHDSQKIIDAALVDYDLQSKKWGSIEDFHTLNRLQMVETVNLCRIFLTSSNIFEKNNFQ